MRNRISTQISTFWLSSLRLLALLACMLGLPAMAQTQVAGDITTDTRWELQYSPYQVTSDLSIDQGALLIIEPGVKVEIAAGVNIRVRYGGIAAVGTATDPITFTSYRDSDGQTPAKGDWGNFVFESGTLSSLTILERVKIRYGRGMQLFGASPMLNRVSFEHNTNAAITIDDKSSPIGAENQAFGNDINAIEVLGNTLTGEARWSLTGIPYYVQQSITVGNGWGATEGDDHIIGYETDDVIDGKGGNDTIEGRGGNDTLYGGTGDDKLYGQEGNDKLYGGEGNDYLEGGNGNDYLEGGPGNDRLYGGNGDDELIGGPGDDHLEGGNGSDIYRFNLGDGKDTISNYDSSSNKTDRLVFGEGIAPEAVQISRSGDDLILKINENDQVTIQNYFYQDGVSVYRLEEIVFADGTVWDVVAVKAMFIVSGTEGDDHIIGYETDDVIDGKGGNDTIEGRGGNDTLYGGTGDDKLYGQEGNDKLYGGEGNDYLEGGNGNDYLEGGPGNDRLYGGNGDDELIGGPGDDHLEGGNGSDIYRFNLGDGKDTISNYDYSSNKTDRLVFGEGIAPEAVQISRSGDDLILKINENDQVTIQNYFYQDGVSVYRLEEIVFADGTVWDVVAVKAMFIVSGTEGDDHIIGYETDDVIDGKGGNDTIEGRGGNDTLYGGTGDDKLYGQEGNDKLYGGEGNDYLEGGNGNDYLEGGPGNDRLYGGNGDDELIGGPGDDHLEGGNGSDIYRFNLGDGKDTISNYDYSSNKTDRLVFGEGIAPEAVQISRSGDDLILKINENDQVTIQNYFYQDGVSVYRLEEIVFADGTVWDVVAVKAMFIVSGTEGDDHIIGYETDDVIDGKGGNDTIEGRGGNDTLYGGTGDDKLYGQEGNDKLYGGEGNDYLEGGNGNDYLEGGPGNDRLYGGNGDDELIGGPGDDHLEGGNGSDIYRFNLGDGKDTISNYDYSSNKTDRLVFGEGIAPEAVQISRSGDDLILKINENDQVTIQNYFYQDGVSVYRLEEIVFADGTVWDVVAVKAMFIVSGTEGDDHIIGYETDDVIDGKGGNDTIEGRGGNDTLYGGTGDDKLYGQEGNDKLYGGEGNDYLEGGNGNDYLEGGPGNDRLYGGNGDDELIGGPGDDHLEGGNGSDIYRFNLGDGKDTISNYDYSSNKTDRLVFGEGIAPEAVQISRSGDDLILKINENDQVTIQNYFYQDGVSVYRLEEIVFADGTVWNYAAVAAQISQ